MSEELSSSDWPFLTFPVLEAIYKSPQIASDRPMVHIKVVLESPLEVVLEVGSPQCEPALSVLHMSDFLPNFGKSLLRIVSKVRHRDTQAEQQLSLRISFENLAPCILNNPISSDAPVPCQL